MAQRAEELVGETVEVLVEEVDAEAGTAEGRAAHQAPEVDGSTTVVGDGLQVGRIVSARVVGTDGADLVAELVPDRDPLAVAALA